MRVRRDPLELSQAELALLSRALAREAEACAHRPGDAWRRPAALQARIDRARGVEHAPHRGDPRRNGPRRAYRGQP